MCVGDQHRSGDSCRGGGELVPVDQSHAGLDGVDREPGPHQVEERHGRKQHALDTGIVAKCAHRPFEHERRPGNHVDHLAELGGGGNQPVGDLGIDVVEGVGPLVQVVERDRVVHEMGRGVHRCAQEAMRNARDRRQRLAGHVVDPTGAEPGYDDPRQRVGHRLTRAARR